MIIASAVMSTGRKRVNPDSMAASSALPCSASRSLANDTIEDAIGGGDAHAHDRAHQRRDAKRGVSDKQENDDAGQRGGQRRDDNERIQPGLEIHHDQ